VKSIGRLGTICPNYLLTHEARDSVGHGAKPAAGAEKTLPAGRGSKRIACGTTASWRTVTAQQKSGRVGSWTHGAFGTGRPSVCWMKPRPGQGCEAQRAMAQVLRLLKVEQASAGIGWFAVWRQLIALDLGRAKPGRKGALARALGCAQRGGQTPSAKVRENVPGKIQLQRRIRPPNILAASSETRIEVRRAWQKLWYLMRNSKGCSRTARPKRGFSEAKVLSIQGSFGAQVA